MVIALAVFRHSVLFGECLSTSPTLVACVGEARAGRGLGEANLNAATVRRVG